MLVILGLASLDSRQTLEMISGYASKNPLWTIIGLPTKQPYPSIILLFTDKVSRPIFLLRYNVPHRLCYIYRAALRKSAYGSPTLEASL